MNSQKGGEGIPPRPHAAKRGYGYRWQQQRLLFLRAHPLCAMCEKLGLTVAANVVDHIRRHSGPGDPLFWDRGNWQALCYRCHDSVKQQLDRTGRARGHDAQGWALYPRT
jgi:5-methylcytosine-specific restriction protein A